MSTTKLAVIKRFPGYNENLVLIGFIDRDLTTHSGLAAGNKGAPAHARNILLVKPFPDDDRLWPVTNHWFWDGKREAEVLMLSVVIDNRYIQDNLPDLYQDDSITR